MIPIFTLHWIPSPVMLVTVHSQWSSFGSCLNCLSWDHCVTVSCDAVRWLSLAIRFSRQSCIIREHFGLVETSSGDPIALVLHRSISVDFPIISPVLLQWHWSSSYSVHLSVHLTSALCSVHLSPIARWACQLFSRYAFRFFSRYACCKLSGYPDHCFLNSLAISSPGVLLDCSPGRLVE